MSCRVDVDDEHFDIREVERVDLDDFAELIAGVAGLSDVSVGVDIDLTGGYRLEDSQQVCFLGDVTLQAIMGGDDNLLRDIMEVYRDMESSHELGMYCRVCLFSHISVSY